MPLTPLQAFARKRGQNLSDLELMDLGRINPRSDAAQLILERLVVLASAGATLAMCTCSACFRVGWGAEQRHDLAVLWAKRAADCGYPPGEFELALRYESGVGLEQDIEVAPRLFKKASTGGYSATAFHLTMLYHVGEAVAADSEMALSYAMAAIDLGDAFAALELASRCEDGQGVALDPACALRWYGFAAKHGSVFACARLAKAHSNGELGLQADQQLAERFTRLANDLELP